MIHIHTLSAFKPELKGVIRDIRAVWALEETALPYKRIVMDPMKREHKNPEFLKLNPFGKVPVMTDEGMVLFESTAICTYIGDKTGKLIPKAGSADRARYDQWVAFAISTLEPHASRVFGFDFFHEMNQVKTELRNDSLNIIDGIMAGLDSELSGRNYLLGNDFSIADIILCTVYRSVIHTDVAAKHKNLSAYFDRCLNRPAAKKAFELNG